MLPLGTALGRMGRIQFLSVVPRTYVCMACNCSRNTSQQDTGISFYHVRINECVIDHAKLILALGNAAVALTL